MIGLNNDFVVAKSPPHGRGLTTSISVSRYGLSQQTPYDGFFTVIGTFFIMPSDCSNGLDYFELCLIPYVLMLSIISQKSPFAKAFCRQDFTSQCYEFLALHRLCREYGSVINIIWKQIQLDELKIT